MEYHCCSAAFFEHIVIIVVLVLFAGLMSGLTLGLMSLSLVDLEVLAKSGTEQDRKHAGIHPAVATHPVPVPCMFSGAPGPFSSPADTVGGRSCCAGDV